MVLWDIKVVFYILTKNIFSSGYTLQNIEYCHLYKGATLKLFFLFYVFIALDSVYLTCVVWCEVFYYCSTYNIHFIFILLNPSKVKANICVHPKHSSYSFLFHKVWLYFSFIFLMLLFVDKINTCFDPSSLCRTYIQFFNRWRRMWHFISIRLSSLWSLCPHSGTGSELAWLWSNAHVI